MPASCGFDTWDNVAVRSELVMGRDEYEFEACDASLIGRERAALSVTGNSQGRGGDGAAYAF